MNCPRCGALCADVSDRCATCGAVFVPASARPVVGEGDDAVSHLIPYKNPRALIAYYLAVFSLIPCLGIPLGIAAFVFGLLGLAYLREQPEAHGKVHAWIGIVLGALTVVGQVVGVVVLVFSR